MSRRICSFTILFASILAPVAAQGDGQLYLDPLYGYSRTTDIVFGIGNTNNGPMQLLLDVYQPTDIGLGAVQSNRPAIVIQDGGAWTSGDKQNGRVVTPAIFLAQRGYTVFSTNSRQVGDSPSTAGPGPWSNLNPAANGSVLGFLASVYPNVNTVRVGIEDYASAITYVRNNGSLYGIDSDHIAGIGGSSGAINLLDLQYNGDTSNASYRTQANISAVGSMMGDWDKVGPNGAPLMLWNNQLDPLIHYFNDIPNLHGKLEQNGIYYEQWFMDPNIADHNVHYEQYPTPDPDNPYMAGFDNSKLILDRMAEFLANQFTPTGPITISNQSLAVASTDNGGFVKVDYNGNASLVGENVPLTSPLDFAHDASNNQYAVDGALSRILKYDTNGNSSIFADGSDGLVLPTSIATNGTGPLYVANYLTSQILELDANGNSSVFANSADGLNRPFGLALDASGNVYAAEVDSRRIVKFDNLGNMSIFADASDGLITPIAMEFDAAGNLFVADAALSKIFKFDTLGNVSVFADGSDGLLFPTGLAFDSAGFLYVSNYLTDKIMKFDVSGIGSVFATAIDGIDGPFGLDLMSANAAFAQFSAQITAVPEVSSLLMASVATIGLIVPLWKRSRSRRN